ncbi:MAG: FAD-dependent oxidoreductase, partial [Gemmataceae bacterium]
ALNPAAAGLELASKGRFVVDKLYRTNVPHIYAVGDVIGFPALASTSAEQGRQAALDAAGVVTRGAPAILPTGIYTIPEVSSAGATEAELQKAGRKYIVGRARYSQTPRGQIIGDRDGFLKLLFDAETHELIGIHVLGELATELLHVGLVVMTVGGGADVLTRTCFNYPTLGELYQQATLDALGTSLARCSIFPPPQVDTNVKGP